MRNVRMTILMATVVLILAAGQGFGWIQYKDGGTHSISYPIYDDVWVDYQAPSMQTTVNLLNGGGVFYKLQGFNSSRLNVSGGSVSGLIAHDNSRIAVSDGGEVGQLEAYGDSQIAISGQVGTLYGKNNSQATASDANIGCFDGQDSSRLNILSGKVLQVYINNNSQVIMSGGQVISNLVVSGNGQITMTGGQVDGTLVASEGGRITWSAGTIGSGAILQFSQNANLRIIGSNFAIDGSPVGFGDIASILGGSSTEEPHRLLTGTLANGDVINNQFIIGELASITLIPEPCTLLLLGVGGILLRRKMR